MIEIPLVGGAVNAHQEFDMQLGDNFFSFTLNYVTLAGPAWSLDIDRDGTRLISGAMLEPGAELTRDYHHLNIGRLLFVGDDVTLDNLGTANQLVWVPDE